MANDGEDYVFLEPKEEAGNRRDVTSTSKGSVEGKKAQTQASSSSKTSDEDAKEAKDKVIKFNVLTLGGQKFDISIQKEKSIYQLKKQIERTDDNFPVKAQKFMFKGEPLKNVKGTVSENGLTEGCKLYLVKRLRTESAEVLDPPPKKGAHQRQQQGSGGAQLIRVLCPANARAGSRVRISLSDGRQLLVQVPQGVGPGMPFQVALQSVQPQRRQGPPSGIQPRSTQQQSRMLRVLCPQNARPGSIVAINVPGRGPIHVRVPQGVMPGRPFNVQI